MFNKLIHIVSIALIIIIFSCKKETVLPDPILVNITLSAGYISHTPQSLTFKVRFAILDSRFNNELTEVDINNFVYITPYIGNTSGITYTYTLDSIKKTYTPFLGNNTSAAIMIDESKINESDFNNNGPKYVYGQETACRTFFKLSEPGSNFILSAYASGNTFLPQQPLTIYGNGFTNNSLIYDQPLADLRRYNNLNGNSPFLSATDSMLKYINQNATNNNKQLIAFTRSDDNVGGIPWDSVITKARNFHIPCNIVMTYQGTVNFAEYVQMACETGGFLFFVENNQDGKNLPMFGDQLNNILKGNFRCFETVWTVHASQPIFYSGTTELNYIELYMDNNEKLYTYMPYYVRIP